MKQFAKYAFIIFGLAGVGLYFGYYSDSAVIARANPDMVALAEASGMSEQGTAIFLRTDPERVDVDTLNANCGDIFGADTGFGCFMSNENKIYIRDMPEQFDDVEAVTAAHEMLHAVEYRYGLDDDISQKLDEIVETMPDDSAFAETMEVYEDLDESEFRSEVYAAYATEVGPIDSLLETHYSDYFEDRNNTVDLHVASEQQFLDREAEMQETSDDIDALNALADEYYSLHTAAANAGDEFNFDRYYGLYTSTQEEANALVDVYNAQADEYNELSEAFNGKPIETIEA